MKIRPVVAELFQAYGRTDMMKLVFFLLQFYVFWLMQIKDQ
jgi:hypothetical protein